MEISNTIYLSLGSNIGDRLNYLEQALVEIKKTIGEIRSCSSVYATEAIGFETENEFLNMCIECKSDLIPSEVLQKIHSIEKQLNRVRNSDQRYTSRTLDIDIIFFNDFIIESSELQVPHPEYPNRLFVLEPLIEINPNLVDPRNNERLTDILIHQQLVQKIYKTNFVLTY